MFLKEFFEKVNFEKKSADDSKSMKNYPVWDELISINGTKTNSFSTERKNNKTITLILFTHMRSCPGVI